MDWQQNMSDPFLTFYRISLTKRKNDGIKFEFLDYKKMHYPNKHTFILHL